MKKRLRIHLDSMWEDGYEYTEYDIGGLGHYIVIDAKNKEKFLDAWSKACRKRAEDALYSEEEDIDG